MSCVTGQDQTERELFERAQARLDEAFTLLRTLESQLQASEGRRQQAHLDVQAIAASLESAAVDLASFEKTVENPVLEPADGKTAKADVITPALAEGITAKPARAPRHSEIRRAEERDQLLAYVESAHAEAIRLKEGKRPLSRAQRQEIVRRITQRVEQVAAQLEIRESGTTPWEESGRHGALEPTTVAHVSSEGIVDQARLARARAHTVIADDERKARARAETIIAPREEDARETEIAPARTTDQYLLTRSSSGESHVDIKVPAQLVTVVAPLPAQDTAELPPLPKDFYEDPDAEETFVPTLITANPMLEREKSGARLRRDRSPTEVMERAPTARNTGILGYYSRRTVLIASAVVAGIMMIAGVSFFMVRLTRTPLPALAEVPTKPVLVAPAQIETTPAAPGETTPTQVRTIRKAAHVSPAPATKATPKCASAKCRGSTAGHAKKTTAAAMVQAPVMSNNAVSPGRIGSLARRDTINAAPSIAAKPMVRTAHVTSP